MGASLLLLACLTVGQTPEMAVHAQPNVAVVCPEAFRPAIEPWARYRTGQGYRLAFVTPNGDSDALRESIRTLGKSGSLEYVVLIGDAPAFSEGDVRTNAPSRVTTPTCYAEAKVNVAWGSEPHIATDAPLGDLDGDGVPELAVGRIPADTPTQAAMLLGRVMQYEQSRDFGPWRRKVNVIAGVGDFGFFIDTLVESITKALLVTRIPAEYDLSMTQAGYKSPYYPGAAAFRNATIERFNEGCLFWVYMGHGWPYGLDYIRTPQGDHPILEARDMAHLDSKHAWPVALFFACYTGAYDAPEDCLAEQMMLQPNGPVAAYASSRVSMPYAMSVMGYELIGAVTQHRADTVGKAVVEAKRRLAASTKELAELDGKTSPGDGVAARFVSAATGQGADAFRGRIDALAEAFRSKHYDPSAERREHLLLFNLLGDPTMRLAYPKEMTVRAEPAPAPGSGHAVMINCENPIAGRARIELVARRDQLTFERPRRETRHRDSGMYYRQHFAETYAKANDRDWVAAWQTIETVGHLETTLHIPREARGPCVARVFIEGEEGCAFGAVEFDLDDAMSDVTMRRAPDRR